MIITIKTDRKHTTAARSLCVCELWSINQMFNLSWECEYDEIRKRATTSSPAALTKPGPVFITKKKPCFPLLHFAKQIKEWRQVCYVSHRASVHTVKHTRDKCELKKRERDRERESQTLHLQRWAMDWFLKAEDVWIIYFHFSVNRHLRSLQTPPEKNNRSMIQRSFLFQHHFKIK